MKHITRQRLVVLYGLLQDIPALGTGGTQSQSINGAIWFAHDMNRALPLLRKITSGIGAGETPGWETEAECGDDAAKDLRAFIDRRRAEGWGRWGGEKEKPEVTP